MTDFTQAQVAEGLADNPSVSRPGAGGGPAGVAALAEGAAELVSIFARKKASERGSGPSAASVAKTKEDASVSAYLLEQQRLADAAEQAGPGRLPEFQARSRALYRQSIAANPQAGQALASAHKNFVAPSGLGPVIQDVGEEERRLRARWDSASEDGAIDPNATPQEQEMQFRTWSSAELLKAQMNSGQVSDQFEGQEILNSITRHQLDIWGTGYKVISQQSGEVPMGDILQQLAVSHDSHLEELDRIALKLENPEDVDLIKTMLTRKRDIAVSIAKGEFDTNAAKAQLDSLKATETLAFTNASSEGRAVLTASQLNIDTTVITPRVMKALSAYMSQALDVAAAEPDITRVDNSPSIKEFKQGVLLPSIKASNDGLLSEQGKEDIITSLNSILRGVPENTLFRDPRASRNVSTYMSDPVLGKFMVENHQDLLEFSARTATVLQSQYSRELQTVLAQEVETDPAIRVSWTGGGVKFEGPNFFEVARLNSKASRLLNEYIRANAHLEGTLNYEKWWNDNQNTIIPVQMQADTRIVDLLEEDLTKPPTPGDVIRGWKFTGGDPSDRNSWTQ